MLKSVSYGEESIVSLDNLLISGKHFQSNVEVKDRVKLKYYLLLESKLKVVSLHNKLKVYATLELSERVSGQRFLNLHLSKGRFRVILFPQLRNIPFELFPWMLCTFLFCELSNSYIQHHTIKVKPACQYLVGVEEQKICCGNLLFFLDRETFKELTQFF